MISSEVPMPMVPKAPRVVRIGLPPLGPAGGGWKLSPAANSLAVTAHFSFIWRAISVATVAAVIVATRAGDVIEGLERRLAPGDREPGELDPRRDLDYASDNNQPQKPETGFGPGLGREDQLARADDRAGDDHAGPEHSHII
jgi:hypothetical protein